MVKTKERPDRKSRTGGKYSDVRIDELIAANKTIEARQLVEEKLRSAHEQGNETLQNLYKHYLEQLEIQRKPAEK